MREAVAVVLISFYRNPPSAPVAMARANNAR